MRGRKESQKPYWKTEDRLVLKIWEEFNLYLRTPLVCYDIIVMTFIHYNCKKWFENHCLYAKLLYNHCSWCCGKVCTVYGQWMFYFQFGLWCMKGLELTDLGSLTISKYALHSQWSKSEEIICSICECLSILKSISPLIRGVLYLKHRKVISP